MTISKFANSRAIGKAHRVGQLKASYSPKASSARRTDLSWQALKQVAEANPDGFTVQQYLDAQREVNPENIGDALPCFRYWAANGNVEVLEPAPEEPKAKSK